MQQRRLAAIMLACRIPMNIGRRWVTDFASELSNEEYCQRSPMLAFKGSK